MMNVTTLLPMFPQILPAYSCSSFVSSKSHHHKYTYCRNPSFGLATKAKGIARVRAKRKPGS